MSLRTAKDFVNWYDIGFPSDRLKLKDRRPSNVVFLLGWMECRNRHLSPASTFYGDKGFAIVRYYPLAQTFTASDADKVLTQQASHLLQVLRLNNLDKNPLYFHCFSYAGAIMYHFLRQQFESTPISKFIAGIVFDSCPVFVDDTALLPESGFKKMISSLIDFFGFVNDSYQHLVLNACVSLRRRASLCPELFLYSKGDKVVDYKSVEAFVAQRDKMGVVTDCRVWEDSDHVDHMKCHPEEYISKVEAFLIVCANVDYASENASCSEGNGNVDNLMSRL